ncbi:cytochrome b561 [Pseudomonas duriflava]|uniref:Cytochrome b561 n=1 Tax=Pseudomonas duriflava TaxID=459528 RepID=A0A562QFD3_9PSED|nr:cytochrome b [Pseudomonas duriflava]TWI54880.1 cytochrome b561 [Pseudomonas duriflava]
MGWRNEKNRYGLVSVVTHWIMAIAIVALFWLGLWMRELDYYSPWYHRAPELHKGIGILLLITLILRIVWRFVSAPPPVEGSVLTRRVAKVGHFVLYALMLGVMIAGYLISTAEGQPISVFGWFEVPATLYGWRDQADQAGVVHLWLAWTLIILSALHMLAALKHHFIDRDTTLLKMLGRART